MKPGLVRARTRWVCLSLTAVGTVLLLAGLLLAVITAALRVPGRWYAVPGADWGLMATGMGCGLLMLVVGRPGARTRPRASLWRSIHGPEEPAGLFDVGQDPGAARPGRRWPRRARLGWPRARRG